MIYNRERILPVLVWALALAWTAPAAELSVESWTLHAAIQRDDSIWVTETMQVRLVPGPAPEVVRRLFRDGSEGITELSARADGNPFPPGKGIHQAEISGSDPVVVVWRFPPRTDGMHVVVLKYRILGAVRRRDQADLVDWAVLPRNHGFAIRSWKVWIALPPEARWAGEPSVGGWPVETHRREDRLELTAADVPPHREVRVVLRFGAGTLGSGAASQKRGREVSPFHAALFAVPSGLLLAGGLLGFFLFYRRYHPGGSRGSSPRSLRPAPPENMPPALAGVLISYGAQAHWTHFIATLVDLAQRGFLVVRAAGDRHWYHRGGFAVLPAAKSVESLLPFERMLYETLFAETVGQDAPMPLSEGLQRVRSRWKKFSRALKEEMKERGLLSAGRDAGARLLLLVSLGMDGLGIAFFLMAVSLQGEFGNWAFLPPIALVALGVAGWAGYSFWSPLSDAAEGQASDWQGFCARLLEIAGQRGPSGSAADGENYLGYAISFGLGPRWCRAMENRGLFRTPHWFQAGVPESRAVTAFHQFLGEALRHGGSRSDRAGRKTEGEE